LAGNVVDETEIPDISHRLERRPDGRGGAGGGAPTRPSGKPGRAGKPGDKKSERHAGTETTGFVYVGLGRAAGIRPGDLVGAIANETDLVGREIGPIKITEKFAIVGVPDRSVDKVLTALKRTTIKGKKPTVRRYVD
jgi:ATP-dependent RNA helicase DeaD